MDEKINLTDKEGGGEAFSSEKRNKFLLVGIVFNQKMTIFLIFLPI